MTTRRTWLIGSAAAAVAVFVLMWIGWVQGWTWLARADAAGLEPLYRFGIDHPAWVTAWDVYCSVFSPAVVRVATLIVIVVALIRRRLRIALFLVVSVEFSALLTQLFKDIADRPRPGTSLVTAHSTSFPSGHALGMVVCVLAFLVLVGPRLRPSWRGWAVAAGVAVIVTIGVGRVVLNVHHPSDVVAGWAIGYAYFVACLLLLPPTGEVTAADGTPAARGTAR